MVEGNTRRVLGEHSKSVRVTKGEREGGEKSGRDLGARRKGTGARKRGFENHHTPSKKTEIPKNPLTN